MSKLNTMKYFSGENLETFFGCSQTACNIWLDTNIKHIGYDIDIHVMHDITQDCCKHSDLYLTVNQAKELVKILKAGIKKIEENIVED